MLVHRVAAQPLKQPKTHYTSAYSLPYDVTTPARERAISEQATTLSHLHTAGIKPLIRKRTSCPLCVWLLLSSKRVVQLSVHMRQAQTLAPLDGADCGTVRHACVAAVSATFNDTVYDSFMCSMYIVVHAHDRFEEGFSCWRVQLAVFRVTYSQLARNNLSIHHTLRWISGVCSWHANSLSSYEQ